MGHYAKVKDGKVTEVIVATYDYIKEREDKDEWIKTSYNTRGGKHYAPNQGDVLSDNQAKALRWNFAGIGYHYDKDADAFYAPKPFDSWILDKGSYTWRAPKTMPEGPCWWNEDEKKWIEVTQEADLSNPPEEGGE